MTVTEFATLRFGSSYTWDSPDIQAFLQTLATQQAEWSGYPLRFFEDLTDRRIIYLITGWKSVPAHYEWIASAQNKKLVEWLRGSGMIEVAGLEHAELDSEVADGQYVVWRRWEAQEGDDYQTEGPGRVLDSKQEKRMVSSLQSYADKEAAEVNASEGDRIARKLVLS